VTTGGPDLSVVREALLDADALVRAVASGRRRSAAPPWRRVELRHVDLKAGRHLQVTAYDATQAHTHNHAVGDAAAAEVDRLLAEPFGNWHVETATHTIQVRVTKKGDALVSRKARAEAVAVEHDHDRAKQHLLPPDDPLWRALGLAGADGRVKPSRASKVRQVEEFLRLLDGAITDARAAGQLRRPTASAPLRIADLGCGNAYLTLAAQRYLAEVRGIPVVMTGVDVKEQSREHSSRVAAELGLEATFLVGTIAEAVVDPVPEVVLALHACDTATDEALARAVGWRAPLVLAAPCCHHDVAAQLRREPTPSPYAELTRHGILRERLADTLTDALRAGLMRLEGYRVDVVQFVESEHTPRNTMLRATRAGAVPDDVLAAVRADHDALVEQWRLRPRLAELLAGR
jgi:SAM-dependent methyltransferase